MACLACLACLILLTTQATAAAGLTAFAGDQSKQSGQDERNWERVEVPDVPSVAFHGYRYVVVHWGKARGLPQNGGYISVVHQANGKERALIKIYETTYDPEMEADVQDVFITSLSLSGNCILIKNERGDFFVLDTHDHSVMALSTSAR